MNEWIVGKGEREGEGERKEWIGIYISIYIYTMISD